MFSVAGSAKFSSMAATAAGSQRWRESANSRMSCLASAQPALRAVGLPTEEMGIDTLGTARLWLDIKQAGALRASYSAGWQEGGEIGA